MQIEPELFKYPQLSEFVAVAAVANAVVKLKSLETLELTDMPDLWGKVYRITNQSAVAVAATAGKDVTKVLDVASGN